jgi:hypothetical protein
MIFGTVFTGHVKTQEHQWIESKVFCLGIPLYVTTTMLVTEVTGSGGRLGIEIKTNKISIAAAVIRPIITIFFVFSVAAFIANYDEMLWLLAPAVTTTALFVYSWFFFGKTTKRERFVRKQFGTLVGIYFMPHWLDSNTVQSYINRLKEAYISHFGTTDWKVKLKGLKYEDDAFTICYCLTALENTIAYDAETDRMLNEIAAHNPAI